MNQSDLWMHAGLVGEIRILSNLIAFLIKNVASLEDPVTAVTPTELETARSESCRVRCHDRLSAARLARTVRTNIGTL